MIPGDRAAARGDSTLTGPAPRIRRLEQRDSREYRALMLQAYELAPDAFTSTAQERAAEPDSFWQRRLADPSEASIAFGAFLGERLVGTVTVEFQQRTKTAHKAHAVGMYVAPEARGCGAGAALIEAAIGCARARDGVLLLNLTVTEGNGPAERLYRKAGFIAFGVEPMAVRTPDGFRSKVHMWLPLRP